jgi:hypothetical protein
MKSPQVLLTCIWGFARPRPSPWHSGGVLVCTPAILAASIATIFPECRPIGSGRYDTSTPVCRTTLRPMGHLRGSCGTAHAILSRNLGIGAITPWIIYASMAVPMIVMLSHREIGVDPLIRWLLYTIIALSPLLPA